MDKFNEHFLLLKKFNNGRFFEYQNHSEANEYSGCEYSLQKLRYLQRTAKITPKKVGQFVTLWKRNQIGITAPYSTEDNFNFVVIIVLQGKRVGRFLFPKEILSQKKILSSASGEFEGKRGFRVYPKWDTPTSRQAIETQIWQLNYFSENLNL